MSHGMRPRRVPQSALPVGIVRDGHDVAFLVDDHEVELWDSGGVGSPQDPSRRKIIDHPDVGLIALDCDALIVAGDDLRITVYTAEPGTEDAERLALAVVLGTQALID